MVSGQRLNVLPTRMNLKQLNLKLEGVTRGYTLLKRKADSLTLILKNIEATLNEENTKLQKLSTRAYTAISELRYYTNTTFIEKSKPRHTLSAETKLVSGIAVERLALQVDDEVELHTGSSMLNRCTHSFISLLKHSVKVASLNKEIKTISSVLTFTNTKVNALEYFIIPRLKNSISYVEEELEEYEREELYRTKKIINKNK